MQIEKPEIVLWTMAFLAPGFILLAIANRFVPSRGKDESLLKLLTSSAINYAVWVPLIIGMLYWSFFTERLWALVLGFTWVTLIGPIILGTLYGLANQRDWFGKGAFRLFKLNMCHPIPVSWDYALGNRTDQTYLRVTLKDGTVVHGLYGHDSFASSYPDGNDMYLETVCVASEDGTWSEHSMVQSILIAAGEIRCVEFMKPAPSSENEENEQREELQRRVSTQIGERASAPRDHKRSSAEGQRQTKSA